MKLFLVISCLVVVALARPEPPRSRYGPPPPPPQNYGPPAPQKDYGPPPKQEYGPPPPKQPQYLPPPPPATSYGPPETTITKNVYVHVPPEEPIEYLPSQPIQITPPKKHYKIIFIKAPNPPKLAPQVIPQQPQDEHKTLVYVLVKKPEPQPAPIVAEPAPTIPTKPEVFFIKYKNNEKQPAAAYGPPPTLTSEYGPPSGNF